jgi:hypothetical protein
MEREDDAWLRLEDDVGISEDDRGIGVSLPTPPHTDPATATDPLLSRVDDALLAASSARRREQLVRACRV